MVVHVAIHVLTWICSYLGRSPAFYSPLVPPTTDTFTKYGSWETIEPCFSGTDQEICLSLPHQTIKETPSHHYRIFFYLRAYTTLKLPLTDNKRKLVMKVFFFFFVMYRYLASCKKKKLNVTYRGDYAEISRNLLY